MQKRTKKPRLLDLFCGAGGCSAGYHRAGFDVVGVDINPQPHYPFEFHQADAMTFPLNGFDVIHASPPCQAYSRSRNMGEQSGKNAPKLIEAVRRRLQLTTMPWIIENVEGAPLNDFPLFGSHRIMICGAAFGLGTCGFDLMRHRLFESNITLKGKKCCHQRGKTIGVYGNGTNLFHRNKFGRCVKNSELREAMGIDWMNRKELSQAIPPAYCEFIGKQLIKIMEGRQ